MHCPHCGNNIPPQSTFCLHCGRQIYAPQPQQSQRKESSGPAVMLATMLGGGAILAVTISIGLGIAASWNVQHKSNSPTSSQPSVLSIAPQEHPIVNDSFTVGAREMKWYTFTVPNGAHISGDFTAQGGANDIEVALCDKRGFANVQNGHIGSMYYHSAGYVTTDVINVDVPAGTYYLVFSNRVALLTNKAVRANVVATY